MSMIAAMDYTDDAHTVHPLVPPDEVPSYPAAQIVQAAAVLPMVPVPGVL